MLLLQKSNSRFQLWNTGSKKSAESDSNQHGVDSSVQHATPREAPESDPHRSRGTAAAGWTWDQSALAPKLGRQKPCIISYSSCFQYRLPKVLPSGQLICTQGDWKYTSELRGLNFPSYL